LKNNCQEATKYLQLSVDTGIDTRLGMKRAKRDSCYIVRPTYYS